MITSAQVRAARGLLKWTQATLAHKAAIDQHLFEAGIPVNYTNVFWGGRSEIKPSEISPLAYRDWCVKQGLDPDAMKLKLGEAGIAG